MQLFPAIAPLELLVIDTLGQVLHKSVKPIPAGNYISVLHAGEDGITF